jgi:hypothetical protein
LVIISAKILKVLRPRKGNIAPQIQIADFQIRISKVDSRFKKAAGGCKESLQNPPGRKRLIRPVTAVFAIWENNAYFPVPTASVKSTPFLRF